MEPSIADFNHSSNKSFPFSESQRSVSPNDFYKDTGSSYYDSTSESLAVSSESGSEEVESDLDSPPKKRRRMAGKPRSNKSSSSSVSTKGWKVPFEPVIIPFAHFEPKIVEKILAHKIDSETHLDMFLVKWRHLSYLHREWITSAELESNFIGGQRIKKFFEKQAELTTGPWGEEGFNPAYLRIDRILDEGEVTDAASNIYYLVKWENMPYDQATWETKEDCEELDMEAVENYLARREIPDFKRNYRPFQPYRRPAPSEWTRYEESPTYKNNNLLRSYQLEGVNWLIHCWLNYRSSIMADEMGLGKTVQSVAFLNELWSKFDVRGPFLVVAPLSTVPHWEREFKTWSDMNVIVYHGRAVARNLIVDTEYYWKDKHGNLVPNLFKFDVLITTYEMAMAGVIQLRPIRWRCCILDEAHKLKNKSSKISELLKTFTMEHRVLLTGTPFQNSLDELWALLNFLEPEVFASEQAFMTQFGSLKNSNDVERLQRLLKPLMLRRLKEDVEKSIPIKEETVIEVELTNIQKKWYRAILERNFSMLKRGTKGRDALPSLINIVMELRKCCIHPYLLQGVEDIVVQEAGANTHEAQFKCMIQASGKLVLLDKLLRKLIAGGHKVLIFSQMTRCLDILSDYLRGQNYLFERLDGNIRGSERQAAIDRFSAPNSDIFAFLLCTHAGGVGINLTAADTAVIFDSDWNPQNDLQAQARCHRIGQTKPVQIYRLITRNTYEKEMFDRAGLKLGLDKAVLQKMDANSAFGDDPSNSSSSNSVSRLSKKEIEELLKKGAYGAFLDESESSAFCEEDIEQILNKRTTVIKHDNTNAMGSVFSKATFITSQASNELDVNDPLFWDKFAEKAHLQPLEPEKVSAVEIMDGPRQRRSQVRAYEQMKETYDEPEYENPVETVIKWSPTEKLYFERRLMVFGLYNWEKLHAACPRRSIQDLRVCARDLIRFLNSKLNPVDDAQMINDCESVVVQQCDRFCNPFGDPLPFPGATPRQVTEYKSFFVSAPKEYLETVERKAKFMLARIQLLKQVHDIVPKDPEVAKQLIIPPITRPPSEWWGPEEDRDLLIGTLKHGYHLFRPMRRDKELVFCKRRYDPNTFQEHVPNGASPLDDMHDDGSYMNGDNLSTPPKRNQGRANLSLQSKQAGDSDDEDDEMECDEEDTENSHLSNAVSIDDSATEENVVLYAWPSKSELGSRLRRIVAAMLREKRKVAAAAAAAANTTLTRGIRSIAPSDKHDANGGDCSDVSMTLNAKLCKWNKRERTDFFRILCTYGVVLQPEPNRDKVDWVHIKELASIANKSDASLTEMYNHVVALCKFLLDADIAKVTGVPCMRPADKFDGDEEYTLDKAKKLFKRIEFMEFLRNQVLTFHHLDKILVQAKRTPGLPEWWQSGTHDRALLYGIAKHGYGRYEALVQDPEFNFYYMAETFRTRDVGMCGKTAVLGLPWPKETIINKRIETLCLLAAPLHKWKQDPSQYTPPAYHPPTLAVVQTAVSHLPLEQLVPCHPTPKKQPPRANVQIEAWNDEGVLKKMTFTLPWNPNQSFEETGDESDACLCAISQFLMDRVNLQRSERKVVAQFLPSKLSTPVVAPKQTISSLLLPPPPSPPLPPSLPLSQSSSPPPPSPPPPPHPSQSPLHASQPPQQSQKAQPTSHPPPHLSSMSTPSSNSTTSPRSYPSTSLSTTTPSSLPLKIRIKPFPSNPLTSPFSDHTPSSTHLFTKPNGEYPSER